MNIPTDFIDLAELAIDFRAVPTPDKKLMKCSEAEVGRYACIWGIAEDPESLRRVRREQQDAGVSPSLRFLESVEIEAVVYLVWILSVHETLTVNDRVTRYRDDYLVVARTDDAASYCTGFYLGHPVLREVKTLRPEHFAYLDHRRYLAREAILDIYRKRISAHPRQSAAYYDLALMMWTFWSMTRPNQSYVTTQILPGPLEEAEEILTKAVELAPKNARYRGLLGEVLLILLRHDEALQAYRKAHDLDRENPRWAFLVADTCLVTGDEAAWRRELMKAIKLARARGGRMDERNARAQYLESLERAAQKLRSKVEHLAYPSLQEMAEQDRAAISIRPDQVPAELRALIPLAKKWGIGDDSSRGYFVGNAGRKERQELARALHNYREQVEAWLDTFSEGEMSDEAGYFMYMLEAAAEME